MLVQRGCQKPLSLVCEWSGGRQRWAIRVKLPREELVHLWGGRAGGRGSHSPLSPAHPDFSRKALGKDSPHFKGHQTMPLPDTPAEPSLSSLSVGSGRGARVSRQVQTKATIACGLSQGGHGQPEQSASNLPVCKTPCIGVKEVKSPLPVEAVFYYWDIYLANGII